MRRLIGIFAGRTYWKLRLLSLRLIVLCLMKVLHHLDNTENGGKFPMVEATFREVRRVLRPNGTMIIATSLPTQIKEALWFCQLNDDLRERYGNRFPTLEQYLVMVEKAGFKCVTKLSVLGNELYENYFDPEGPLKEEWRKTDSMFGLATEKELESIKQFVREMNENGKMVQYIKERDRSSEIGLILLLVCIAL